MKSGDEYVIREGESLIACIFQTMYQGKDGCAWVVLKEPQTGTLFRRKEHHLRKEPKLLPELVASFK